ncbi:MAG: hypothetical protein K8F92_02470 [Hyphomicrobium sp.]|uniref:hypothetical protein n=1 Tax=Hyphomicrobium sp. TaxID=82 RepID=UPI0025BE5DBC|nr:hypothetical protein [Hyphomicrobium sp.]MBZ0208506.1 hypothetical protein [Hyphomicrobium sp.]
MGKISLRKDIQDEVNRYGQRGQRPDLDAVKALLDGIEKLNVQIEEIDKLLVRGR